MLCNFCSTPLSHVFVDLGFQPPSNNFLTKEDFLLPEVYYPLTAYVCESCFLVQVPKQSGDLFTDDYPYYSSQSPSNVSHAKEYADMMCERFGYDARQSHVLEIGSNDGYMLQWFKAKGCRIFGIDPAEGPVKVARQKGIDTSCTLFSADYAWKMKEAEIDKFDLICGINVLAHQPNINDFVTGLKIALKPGGVITFEFPHLQRMVEGLQFDTVYHEHYSYFSLLTIDKIFSQHGLRIFDVDELPEHGGSLRIYAKHCEERNGRWDGERVRKLIERESGLGMDRVEYYQGFQSKVETVRHRLLDFLFTISTQGEILVAYGAPAKGNTFLNYCGIRSDFILFTVDRSPYKQGKFLPGSHIEVVDEKELKILQPDYVLILAWNLKEEIMKQLKYIREWDSKFVVAVPELRVL